MTTENLAILFTDIVGSTELSQRLSAHAADEARREHFSILRQSIAETGGTEVKNLGDGLMVVFGSASAALACGVAMQQGVERNNRKREYSVALRVGLSGGEVLPEDGDYFGDPVIEGARLCALARGGQILATELLRAIAGRRSGHRFLSLGPIELKGLADAVPSCEVEWEPILSLTAGAPGVPLPAPLARHPNVGVIGRGPEIAALSQTYKRIAAGEGREEVLISGEAGLGKTTLVAAAARAAFDLGACVLFGHCEEDLVTPYQLFAEALEQYVTHVDEELISAHVAEYGSELARLVPALGRRVPGLPPSRATDSETERYLLFAAVVGLLAQASDNQPVMLVLDDLQWADTGSLQLFRYLTTSEQQMQLLVLGTYRDSELLRSHPLRETLGALHRTRGVTRLELKGLDDSDVLSFLEAAAGHRLDDAGVRLAHAVYRETDGNPYFVSELLRHLAETGAIYQDEQGRWLGSDSLEDVVLPDSLREVIGARVVRLGAGAERALSLAAVIGRDFDLALLTRATLQSEDELLDLLDAAAAAALVRELPGIPGRYTFAHSLIQHTLYESLGPTRRAQAHMQVAEKLEEMCQGRPGARVAELARHWFNAMQPKDLTRALEYSRQAADAALEALAPHDALRYYTQALDLYEQVLVPDPILGLDLRIGLGTAQRQTGNSAYRDTLLAAGRRAAELGDNGRLVAAALANDRGFFSAVGLIDTDKVETLETALVRLPNDHPDRALLLASLCKELTFDRSLERRRSLANEAVLLANLSSDPASIVRVLNHVSYPLFVPPLLEESLARTADAMRRADSVGDPVLRLWATGLRSIAATCAGDVAELDRCLEIAGSFVAQLDQPTLTWVHTVSLAARAILAGDPDHAEQLATEALRIGTDSGEPDASAVYGAQVLAISFQRGRLRDHIPLMEQAATQDPGVSPFLAPFLAMAQVEAGRTGDARLLLDECAAEDFPLSMDTMWLSGMVQYAEVASECRSLDAAARLLRLLGPWEHQFASNGATCIGPVSHFLGGLAAVLNRYEAAEAYFVQAQRCNERASALFFGVRTDLSYGGMLLGSRRPGDRERARQLLTRAHSVAVANGYGTVERRAAAALQSTT